MSGFSVPEGVTHVLHIGAGTGAEVADYLAAGLNPIVLVESDAQALVHLRSLAQQHAAIQVIEAAVSARADATTFYRCNFPDLSGLAAPTAALKGLFPGLQVLAQEPVTPVTPSAVIGQCRLPTDQPGLLVIEAPGETLPIVAALKEAGLLSRFSELRLQEGHDPLYEGAPGMETLRTTLEGLGYACEVDDHSEDPDRPHLKGHRPALTEEARQMMQALTQALQDSQDTLMRTQALQAETDRRLRLKSVQLDSLLAETEASGAALRSELTQRDQDLAALEAKTAEMQDELKQQTEARVAAEARAAALQDEVTQQGQDLAALEAKTTEVQEELKQQTEARVAAEARAAALQDEVTQKGQDLAALEVKTTEVREEVARQREARETVAAEARENDAALRKELGEAWQMSRDFEQRSKGAAQKLEVEQALRQAAEAALAEERAATEADRLRVAELEQQRHVGRRDLQRAEGQIELIKDLLLRGDVL